MLLHWKVIISVFSILSSMGVTYLMVMIPLEEMYSMIN